MRNKSLFSIGLLLAALVTLIGTGPEAQAQTFTINNVRIYVNPDMVAPAEDGTPEFFATATTSTNLIDGRLPKFTDFDAGTLSLERGGVEITAMNAHNSADPFTANAGDIIAITFQINMTHTEPFNFLHGTLISLGGWDQGNRWRTVTADSQTFEKCVSPARVVWDDVSVTPPATFTAVYQYKVASDDMDANGDWLRYNNQSPFVAWRGAKRATYTATVHYPKVDGSVSSLPTVESVTINAPPAGQSGPSRYHKVRQECLEHHREYGSDYTNACELVHDHGWALPTGPNAVTLENSPQAAYFRAGDAFEVKVKFNEPVRVDLDNPPKFHVHVDSFVVYCNYVSGTGTDELTFRLEGGVPSGHSTFGGILIWEQAFYENTHADWKGQRAIDNPSVITDLAGNKFNTLVNLQPELWAFFTGNPELASNPDIRDARSIGWPIHLPPSVAASRDAYARGVIKYLVDTVPATVWIPCLIKNGVTHREDRRIAVMNLDANYNEAPTLTADDFRAPVTESDVQTGAFDVEFRFFNQPGAIADEVGESFEPDDVDITGTNVVRDDWGVELTYVGLDHRATNMWPPPWRANPGSAHIPGDAKNSASFLVYKATITPALGFQGDVAISLPAGATQDIAGNDSLASNTLTVPVDNPLRVVETPEIVVPETGAYAVGDKIEIEVTYERENLRYIGENPPYLTVYLGDEVAANARHATWARAEDANSTKVTFAYEVAATDVAASVNVAPIGMTVPSGTTLLDDSGQQLQGKSEPANPSGEGLKTLPPQGQGQLQLGESDQGLAPRTEVPINLFPFFEETEPKAAATDVPRSPIVFNELGNGSGDANDWLEFRNVTASAVSLKDWELSVVQDGKQEDTSLIVFPDVSVSANGLLLITHSDPTAAGNVLAGGDDVSTADVEQKGSPHRYLVADGLSLPDDGQFLLILRKAKEKRGLDEAFVDVAGGGGSDTDAFVREQTGDYDTHVWPLQVLEAPGSETAAALGSGKVWQRAKADIVGYHKDAWAEAAFTGLGYDRKVAKSAATAGTPGYPNVAAKEAAAKGSVTFSEIMVDSGGGTLPQWIELYNTSKTEVLNLNRWELEIQNVDSEDLVGRPIVRLTLQEKVIQPNQTLLIVTGDARASSADVFPADRVYNLLALHDKNLRIKKPQDTFLSAEGFYLKLTDRNGQLVDEVGNTDGDRRTKDAPKWLLAMSAEEGVRSSLIRRYTDGTSEAKDGTEKAGWVLAANVKKVVDGALHWGAAEDIGTPGYRKGGALPVELSSFTATRTEAGAVVLTWTTESEVDNAGFNLRRSEKRESGFTLLNAALIAGAGTTGERQEYTFTDTSAKPGVAYYYQIEEVAFDGKRETLAMRRLRGPVSAANRMLTTFGAVKQKD